MSNVTYIRSTETLKTNVKYFIRNPKQKGDVSSATCLVP
jgi:hypothetical protein